MRCFAWVAGLVLLLASRALAQEPLPLELTWRAPAECPTGESVRADLARIANVRSGLTLRRLVARIEVSRRGGAYVAALRTEHEGRAGQRQLEAASCQTLVRSVTLVLALAFGAGVEVRDDESAESGAPGAAAAANSPPPSAATPAGQSEAAPPSNAPGSEATAPNDRNSVAPSQLAPESADETASEPTRLKLNLSLVAGVQLGVLPSAAFAAGLGVELEAHRFSLGLRALLIPGATKAFTTPSDVGGSGDSAPGTGGQSGAASPAGAASESTVDAHFAALGAQLRGCALFPFEAATFAACAAFEVAAVRGTTDDEASVRGDSAVAPRYAVAAGIMLDWPRESALRLRVEANLALALNRPRFEVEDLSSEYRVPRWAPLLAAGLLFTP